MEELVENLGRTLQNIQKIALSDEMLAKVQQTGETNLILNGQYKFRKSAANSTSSL